MLSFSQILDGMQFTGSVFGPTAQPSFSQRDFLQQIEDDLNSGQFRKSRNFYIHYVKTLKAIYEAESDYLADLLNRLQESISS